VSDVTDEVIRSLTEVIGEDFLLDTEITPDTTFEELGLESIEFVALAEKLREHYGEQVNLASFVSQMDIDDVISLTVGTVASYVEAARRGQAELADTR
jgi:acyl carrier protein